MKQEKLFAVSLAAVLHSKLRAHLLKRDIFTDTETKALLLNCS